MGGIRTFPFEGGILVPAVVFLASFGTFFGVFLLQKLQGAQTCNKKYIFPLFMGSGGQIKCMLRRKTCGRISVPAAWPGEKYLVGLLFIHGC